MEALVGRSAELDRIDVVLAARSALPAGVLLHGREGIGKTVLWSEAVRRARALGYRVLDCALSRAESRLAYAGLADLIGPVLAEVRPCLAPPHTRALETALAIVNSRSSAPDERAVAFGLHGALSVLARESPIALAVDDVQWLDPSSTLMLSYAIRRLRREPVLLILAWRDGDTSGKGLLEDGGGPTVERILVGPLGLGAIHRLLRTRLGASLTRPQLLRIHAASEGNPLHALELTRAIHRDIAQPDELLALLGGRVAGLPEQARLAMTLAAVATETDVDVLSGALGSNAIEALGPAIEADLVTVATGRIRFRHPLIAVAAEAGVSDGVRYDLHRRLATATTSPESRIVHLARATPVPDAEVAAAVEEGARRTRARGARASSAHLYEAAARLTPPTDEANLVRRQLAAAAAWYEAGDAVLAERILSALLAELGAGDQRCEAGWRLGMLLDEGGRWQEAGALWKAALAEVEDPGLRSRILCSMAITAFYTDSVHEAITLATSAVGAAEMGSDRASLACSLAVQALTLTMSGETAVESLLERALAVEAELGESLGESLGDWSPSAVAAECARHVGDVEGARRHYATVLERARNAGDANVEQWASFGLASAEILAGRYGRASDLADTVLDIADQTGQMRIPARSLRAHIDAHLGHLDRARELIGEAIARATEADEAAHLFGAYNVLGVIESCAGDAAAAARAFGTARRVAADLGLAHAAARRAFLSEVEVAAAAGELDQADAALTAFEAVTNGTRPLWSITLLHRARASMLVARGDLEAAAAELEAAVAADNGLPPDRGRALLALGSLSRRLRQHARARDLLGQALALFAGLGTSPWIDRASAELARVPGRRSTEQHGLTDAEARIAELVAGGRTNREVASALFLSVKTVEVTLTHVYQKLGVRSRTELAYRFRGPPKL